MGYVSASPAAACQTSSQLLAEPLPCSLQEEEEDTDEGDATDYEDDTSANGLSGAVSIGAREDAQGGSSLLLRVQPCDMRTGSGLYCGWQRLSRSRVRSILIMGHACSSSSMQCREPLDLKNSLASSLLVTLAERCDCCAVELDLRIEVIRHNYQCCPQAVIVVC